MKDVPFSSAAAFRRASQSTSENLEIINRELRRNIFDLHNLFDLSGGFLGPPNFPRLLSSFLLALIGRTGYGTAALLLPGEGGEYRMWCAKGLNQREDSNIGLKKNSALARFLERKSRPLLSSEFRELPGLVREEVDEIHRKVGDAIFFPVHLKDRRVGMIILGNRLRSHPLQGNELRLISAIVNQASSAIENVWLFQTLKGMHRSAIRALVATIEARIPYTVGHAERTSQYFGRIARHMGFSGQRVERLGWNVVLHDIGKISFSESILNNRPETPLSASQWAEVKLHPRIGAAILRKAEFLDEAVELALHHHERYDGRGYPDGLHADAISLEARILCVADSYDAMTTDRPYRKALSTKQAKEELWRNAGTQFDPQVVEAFLCIV